MSIAIILCGGLGTRLKPFTDKTAKPLVKFANIAMLEYQLDALLKVKQINTIVLALSRHVFCEELINFVKSKCSMSQVDFIFSIEDEKLDTGGAIAHALRTAHIAQATAASIFILNGDIWCEDFQLNSMYDKWLHMNCSEEKAMAIMMTTQVEKHRSSSYGVVVGDDKTNLVSHFLEKPCSSIFKETSELPIINAGMYIINQTLADLLIQNPGPLSLEREVFPNLVTAQTLFFFTPLVLKWKDLGRPKDHLEAIQEWFPQGKIDGTSVIHPSSTIQSSVIIGKNSIIMKDCKLKNCIIMEDVVIMENCEIENAMIGDGVQVKPHSVLKGTAESPQCLT